MFSKNELFQRIRMLKNLPYHDDLNSGDRYERNELIRDYTYLMAIPQKLTAKDKLYLSGAISETEYYKG